MCSLLEQGIDDPAGDARDEQANGVRPDVDDSDHELIVGGASAGRAEKR